MIFSWPYIRVFAFSFLVAVSFSSVVSFVQRFIFGRILVLFLTYSCVLLVFYSSSFHDSFVSTWCFSAPMFLFWFCSSLSYTLKYKGQVPLDRPQKAGPHLPPAHLSLLPSLPFPHLLPSGRSLAASLEADPVHHLCKGIPGMPVQRYVQHDGNVPTRAAGKLEKHARKNRKKKRKRREKGGENKNQTSQNGVRRIKTTDRND